MRRRVPCGARCCRRRDRARRARSDSRRSDDDAQGVADHDRLGVRQQGRDGAVRRPGARRGSVARQAVEREGRRRRPPAADQDLRHAGQQAGDGEGVRAEAARAAARTSSSPPATSTSRRRSCRRRSTAACSRSRRASAPTRWARSASARRASSRSASATSRRTKARRWRSTRRAKGWRIGRARDRRRDRLLQERRPGVQGAVHAARRQDRRPGDVPLRSAGTTCRTPSAG